MFSNSECEITDIILIVLLIISELLSLQKRVRVNGIVDGIIQGAFKTSESIRSRPLNNVEQKSNKK